MTEPEHPDMNLDEGHLGGYIRGRQSSVSTVFGYVNGDPATYYPDLWRWVIDTLDVRSVLDLGCGEGHAARFFLDHGCRVVGVDGSVQAERDSVIPDEHVRHDFTMGPADLDDLFDLVWCCEFVEHVEERFLDHYLPLLGRARSGVMMTHALPGQPGHHHVNCQTEEYWIDKLASVGMHHDLRLTTATRLIAGAGHFAERGLVFRPTDFVQEDTR